MLPSISAMSCRFAMYALGDEPWIKSGMTRRPFHWGEGHVGITGLGLCSNNDGFLETGIDSIASLNEPLHLSHSSSKGRPFGRKTTTPEIDVSHVQHNYYCSKIPK